MANVYHFDLGDTNTGPIGLSAQVVAESKEDALKRLRELLTERLDDLHGIQLYDGEDFDEPEAYVRVYIEPDHIQKSDIFEEWPADEDEEMA